VGPRRGAWKRLPRRAAAALASHAIYLMILNNVVHIEEPLFEVELEEMLFSVAFYS
jgi:hypothetical protein